MNILDYERDLEVIDEGIRKDYERLVAERYLPVFSAVTRESSAVLTEQGIPAARLVYHSRRNLIFLQDGSFMLEEKSFSPEIIDGNNSDGLLEIAKAYQERNDYHTSVQTALKICLKDLVSSVKFAINQKKDLSQLA